MKNTASSQPTAATGRSAGYLTDPFGVQIGFLADPADIALGLSADGNTATLIEVTGIPDELLNHPRYRVLSLIGQGGMGAVDAQSEADQAYQEWLYQNRRQAAAANEESK
mgnify:CR=1 FL=1